MLWVVTRRVLPAALVLSPVLAGAAVFGGHVVGKDSLLLLLLAACAAMAVRAGRSRWWLLPLNAAGVVGVLTHESFAVFALPAVVVLLAGRRLSPVRLLSAVAALVPVLAAFALVVVHHGTAEDARGMEVAWNVELSSSRACCLGDNPVTPWPDSAMGYLGESLSQAFSRGTEDFVFKNGLQNSVIPWIVSWAVIGIVLVVCLDARVRRRFLLWFALQSVVCLPLWLVGWDYGRWLAITAVSAVLLTVLAAREPLSPVEAASASRWPRTAVLACAALLFGLPGNGWSVQRYLDATPPVAAWHALDDIRYWW